MSVLIENEKEYTFSFDYQVVAEAVAEKILELEQCPYEVEINLILTDNEEIRKTNLECRKTDQETDVLSFPMMDFTKPANYDILENSLNPCFHPDSGELMLGDIMISIPKACEQAKTYGHELKREYAFLIAHSVLHLLGYDHMERSEEKMMEEKQEAALQELKITR